MSESAQGLGGWSSPKPAEEPIQATCDAVRKAVEEKINSGLPFGKYNATLYVEQVVEGMNYRMKVEINTVSVIRIQVYQSPFLVMGAPTPPQLTAVAADGPLDGPF
ncbi:cystatin-B-like [Sycon ciliatum]|uniref:cystatin-B-like n=1 Tax=Sycon ciliatum TaxID=27933 RepID=UPI0020ABC32A|eukprot:scpid82755/ scgid27645/ Stefin-C